MTLATMYGGYVNSPNTTLSAGISDVATTIPVTELGVFPDAPNLAVIGTGEDAETILYEGKSAATGAGDLTTVTREYDKTGTYGAKKAWLTGQVISRLFTKHDLTTVQANITTLDSPNASIFLMPGGAFLPTTDPSGWEQGETTTNKNCYQYGDFSNTDLGRMQWTVPLPLGWDGVNLTAIFRWTAITALTGTVKWDLAAYAFADGDDLDTALPNVTDQTDTFQTTGLMHVSAETDPFIITGTGKYIIFELTRDYTTDTLGDMARILSVEIKYVRSQTY